MKTVLVISSFVAASRVGAAVSAFCLRRLGHEAIVLPTTLMGRHPGWGDPGGGATDIKTLHDMWTAIQAQDLQIDAVLTGYMGAAEHVDLAADIIAHVKSQNKDAIILVDPVMGDAGEGGVGRLYIPENRAKAIKDVLVPLADYITPNVWELSYLTQADDLRLAAAKLSANVLVTSVTEGNQIGADYLGQEKRQVRHEKFAAVPNGGGDALAAIFLAHLLSGRDPVMAMSKAVASVFKIMRAANALDAGELPLIRTQLDWVNALPLQAKEIDDD